MNSLDNRDKPTVVFLMGPTASGKTDLAMSLFDSVESDIISVDSTLVYRGMDIGTAKPSKQELSRYPHRLVDICEPSEPYSVADFCRDAEIEIKHSLEAGRTPILVGGTMMYFKSLLDGLAKMPETNQEIRQAIADQADDIGWSGLHEELKKIDPLYAAEIHPNHSQRISRALEVYRSSGKTMTELRAQQLKEKQKDSSQLFNSRYKVVQIGLLPKERKVLHERIEKRFLAMINNGLIEEVETLRERGDLHLDLPSMRAVGYRQVWEYLEGEVDHNKMIEKGLAATRQLAKRQLTWLRGWPEVQALNIANEINKNTMKKILNLF